ncbi:nitrogenase cofactor biosynthesis protein NifB [Clostridium estertheticum]|uniref:FeMo cofactor biosynthesis protein NifB n=1 Tax=Clostridium estertheticum subsp. estertheticum TaxID=1552 RepID=A0A1J0GEE7_9CLOT|nr:nitrogenase cofactor biosynthesis protein NifB [Clostridium estertheticum]APC39701.1 nitrogenase cofactor biosynthesis protein NifB [Clostridium estertheticum subsp. estertheticum]MBZ9614259.1 nitrogenase cofactor biosynthesis protein NifB [Clostridium estertheticum subsp. laramiense]WAG74199.1 nitrogenase cofactor biosynthesis protein NifB [Clostridium estertheticum]
MEIRNSVNLSVNPCKMCMPLGGVMALKGIEESMVILHGSQGCSTYIRRHMATHYNEPIDIASSSLTEDGTIYGGAKNLKLGLKNIIKLYNPKIIGVLTTCLAETIGEDIGRIIIEFQEENPETRDIKIIPISTPAYSGTQAEGYYKTLRRLVEYLSMGDIKTKKINIIAANINPGDIRLLKSILDLFKVEYTILPDVSETLDAGYNKKYNKVPEGGTSLRDIALMGGAVATIEMDCSAEIGSTAGDYLFETFGVPIFKCAVPIGLKATDVFINLISQISGKPVPKVLEKQRSRYLDGIIDSHKYNGEGRAIIFGEPEIVYAVTSLCVENGITPLLIATGSKNKILKGKLKELTKDLDNQPIIIDDTDFEIIEKHAKELKANLLIGDSNGRRIEKKLGIKLIRIGFPIHDRVGAQRAVNVGYYGSLRFLDEITNSILERKERGYRRDMYDKYYDNGKDEDKSNAQAQVKKIISMEEKTKSHPCFNGCAHDNARIHIPVAPNCNISCNYCSRKFDCVNESRPGVTSSILSPVQALERFKEFKGKLKNLTVVGIAGPGDALANFDVVKESIQLIKKESPDITFCLSTNGLMLPFYANEILELGVSHITITINTVDPKIGVKLYKEINYLGVKYTEIDGATILLQNQLSGLRYLTSKGLICKVNIVYVKGVNDIGIEDTVKKVKECGAFMTNIMPMINAPGSVFEDIKTVNNEDLLAMRKKCEIDLKQMYHCKQCRADAVGTLGNDISQTAGAIKSSATDEVKPIRFAVASKSGLNVDQHFGHAQEFYIYDFTNGDATFIEKRKIPKFCTGAEDCDDSHEDKIDYIIKTIDDCSGVLALRIGDIPKQKLENKNIEVYLLCDEIRNGIRKIVGEAVS